jgi:hypothetical protein
MASYSIVGHLLNNNRDASTKSHIVRFPLVVHVNENVTNNVKVQYNWWLTKSRTLCQQPKTRCKKLCRKSVILCLKSRRL